MEVRSEQKNNNAGKRIMQEQIIVRDAFNRKNNKRNSIYK